MCWFINRRADPKERLPLNANTAAASGGFDSAHRRRIKTEEKAKVTAAVWGTELLHFLAAQAILHQHDLKKWTNSSYSSYRLVAIHPILQIALL